jgi:hypothetical protein
MQMFHSKSEQKLQPGPVVGLQHHTLDQRAHCSMTGDALGGHLAVGSIGGASLLLQPILSCVVQHTSL